MFADVVARDLSRRFKRKNTLNEPGCRKICSTVNRRLISLFPGWYGSQSMVDSDRVSSPQSHSSEGAQRSWC